MSDDTRRPVRRALVSVYDKAGLEDLARGLSAAGVDYVELTRLQPVAPSTLETGAQVENIVPGSKKIAQLRRSVLAENFGDVVGLTLNVSGGLG